MSNDTEICMETGDKAKDRVFAARTKRVKALIVF
jgi:hypothetical protein